LEIIQVDVVFIVTSHFNCQVLEINMGTFGIALSLGKKDL